MSWMNSADSHTQEELMCPEACVYGTTYSFIDLLPIEEGLRNAVLLLIFCSVLRQRTAVFYSCPVSLNGHVIYSK